MQEVFEKIIEKLEEERMYSYADFEKYVNEYIPCLDSEYDDFFHRGLERALRLVKQAAEEYESCAKNTHTGWIPCSEWLDGISAEETTKLDYKETLKVLQSEMEVDYKQTNADRILSMNIEELADFLVTVETYGYHDQSVSGSLEMLEWLQSEVEE